MIMCPETPQITLSFQGDSCLIPNYVFEIHQSENEYLIEPHNALSLQMEYLVQHIFFFFLIDFTLLQKPRDKC